MESVSFSIYRDYKDQKLQSRLHIPAHIQTTYYLWWISSKIIHCSQLLRGKEIK